jgi:hypothetical protein
MNPLGTRLKLEGDRVDHLSMVPPAATPLRRPVREQRLNPRPLRISQRHTRTNGQLIRTAIGSLRSPTVRRSSRRRPWRPKEALAATLAQDFGIEADSEPSRVRFLERPDGTGEACEESRRHGHIGFWATVGLRIEPGPHGSGGVFTYETELGALPRAFHQAIEDTVHATLLSAPRGRPVTDYRVTLVRSGFAADFRGLTPVVLRRALERAGTRVYEPYHAFEVELPLDAPAPFTARLAAHGAQFGETTGGRTSWLVTGELPVRHVREVELRLPGLTHGEGVWWSRPSGDRRMWCDRRGTAGGRGVPSAYGECGGRCRRSGRAPARAPLPRRRSVNRAV